MELLEGITSSDISRFRCQVLDFYASHGRALPWRQTTDPYCILVSEVMLQQTQVSRVVPYYSAWITRWPTVQALARATRSDVLACWMGLGYNSRAIRLQQAATVIVKEYHGDVLAAMEEFDRVPGVGRYTAQAVRIFAANADEVTVDTNIRRILLHSFQLPPDTSDRDLWSLARRCLPTGHSREWHNALMDYGALLLTSRKTKIPPRTKQPPFQGSSRQLRAQILRTLLHSPCSFQQLQESIQAPSEKLTSILLKLTEEELVSEENGIYAIA